MASEVKGITVVRQQPEKSKSKQEIVNTEAIKQAFAWAVVERAKATVLAISRESKRKT